MPRTAFVILLLLSQTIASAQTRPADALPSADELRQMFLHERYHDVIRSVVAILPLRGEAARHYDRHELLVLKAEAHLRLGDTHLAAKTFDEAAGATADAIDAATARATATLVRRARREGYAAKTGPTAGEMLPIVEPDGRRLALKALYHDERDACAKRLSAAQRADDLPGLLDGLEVVLHLRDFERAAAGGEIDAQAALEPLSDRAEELLEKRLKSIASRADKLDKAANSKKKMGSHYRKRGLAKDEIEELRRCAAECVRFADAALGFANAMRGEEDSQSVSESDSNAKYESFLELSRDAQQLSRRIDAILTADYGGLHEKN